MAGYQYGGDGRPRPRAEPTPEERRRNGLSAAASRPPSALAEAATEARRLEPVREIKGAVKVAKFPAVSQYPFAEIAADGGIWKLDPAAFTWRGKPVAPASLRSAAMNWASKEGWSVKTVLGGGQVYIQFTRKAP